MAIHVFIDNSNIFRGAQRAMKTVEPWAHWAAIRVHYRQLFEVIEADRPALTRVMGGSVPPGNEALWEHARNAGYSTDLLRRVNADDGRLVEQGVDEVLHLKIANTLLDFDKATLVVVSGDGRLSEFSTSFRDQVERALKRGWSAEVWSWRSQMSGRYNDLQNAYATTLSLFELDPYYYSVTFLKGGRYDGTDVGERIVSPVPRYRVA
jgi:hypothetical protein